VPGGYAWAVTIAPIAFATGVGVATRVAAAVGLVALVSGAVVEGPEDRRTRVVVGWVVVASSVATWCLAPAALVNAFDAPRGLAGMLGWALFAFAVASPPRAGGTTRIATARGERMQSAPVWLDRVVLLVALGFGVLVQVPGWRIEPRDRALLIRLIGLAASLGLVVSASAILARYHAVTDDDRGRRRRGARVKGARALWVGAAGLLFGGGIAMHFWP
jgi:hypothetical protein